MLVSPVCCKHSIQHLAGLTREIVLDNWVKTRSYIAGYVQAVLFSFKQPYDENNLVRVYEAD